jgi:hypothetical protein
MNSMTLALQLAMTATAQPDAVSRGSRLAVRGRCYPGLAGLFIDTLSRHWRDAKGKPALLSSAALDDGRWACVFRVAPNRAGELDDDHLDRLADATCRVLGVELKDTSAGYFDLLGRGEFRARCWQSLADGRAGPDLVAELLAEGM